MAIVYRNGRPYLYRSIRRGGRVTSEYVASGVDAMLIASDGPPSQWGRQSIERTEFDEIDRALDVQLSQAKDLARQALVAAGFHQHDQGRWRRKRV